MNNDAVNAFFEGNRAMAVADRLMVSRDQFIRLKYLTKKFVVAGAAPIVEFIKK